MKPVSEFQRIKRALKTGDVIANVTILECLSSVTPGDAISNRKGYSVQYRIRYGCCGREAMTTHYTLMRRVQEQQSLCAACSRKRNAAAAQGKPFVATVIELPEDADQRPELISSEYAALVDFHVALSFPHVHRSL